MKIRRSVLGLIVAIIAGAAAAALAYAVLGFNQVMTGVAGLVVFAFVVKLFGKEAA